MQLQPKATSREKKKKTAASFKLDKNLLAFRSPEKNRTAALCSFCVLAILGRCGSPPLREEASHSGCRFPSPRTPAPCRIYARKSCDDWPAHHRTCPFSLPRLPPHPHSPSSLQIPLLGWAGRGRPRGAGMWAAAASLASRTRPLLGQKTARAPEKYDWARTCLRLRESDPDPGAASPHGCGTRKLPICNQNPLSYWACPVTPLKRRSPSVSISVI